MRQLRYFTCIFCLLASANVYAGSYRIFFKDKGSRETLLPAEWQDLPVFFEYIHAIELQGATIGMQSRWLNYVVVETEQPSSVFAKLPFVKNIEKIEQEKFSSGAVLSFDINEAPNDAHRQWQLDTLGYEYFKENGVDGKGIVVAIIDAGFSGADKSDAFTDIFSSGRVLFTYDLLDKDSNVFHGSYHGSMVWSCIAGNKDGKPTGLATGASFILLRSEDEKTETTADEDRWIQALEMAVLHGADIVNSSVGFSVPLHKKEELNGGSLIAQAANLAAGRGVLIVQSAGNEYITLWKTLITPADAEKVITTGGIDKQGHHAFFSSVGPTADGRAKPDIVAPGTCVVVKDNSFIMVNGTSFAAPMAAGYLACMLQLKGKKNFNKDTLLVYTSGYPYHDYVFGYGVPGIEKKTGTILFNDPAFTVDKTEYTLKFTADDKKDRWVFLKIENSRGEIRFSGYVRVSAQKGFKPAVTEKTHTFDYSKYRNPQPGDQWIFWWKGNVYKY